MSWQLSYCLGPHRGFGEQGNMVILTEGTGNIQDFWQGTREQRTKLTIDFREHPKFEFWGTGEHG